MIDSSFGEVLSWHGFVGRKRKKGLRDWFLVSFGCCGGREIGELLIMLKAWTKPLKILSCFHFCDWVQLYIDETIFSMVYFVDWVGICYNTVADFCVFVPIFSIHYYFFPFSSCICSPFNFFLPSKVRT